MELAPDAQTLGQRKYLEYLLASVLEGYVATVDCPAAALTPELMELYPSAVVIATTRDEKSWWESMQFVYSLMGPWWMPLLVMWLPGVGGGAYFRWCNLSRRLAAWRWGLEDGVMQPDTLQRHEEHLREVVPPERLFWYRVSDGWGPLCEILGVPIPARPFPHNNSRKDAEKVYRDLVLIGFVSWVLVLTLVGTLAWYCWGKLPTSTELTAVLRSGWQRDVIYGNASMAGRTEL
jgi:hypothetical protein